MTFSLPSPSCLFKLPHVDDSANVIWKCNFVFVKSFLDCSVISLAICVLTILELNWTSASEIRQQHHMVTSSRQPQIRSCHENENVYEMCKNEKCTCKACKIFFTVRYANLWGSCWPRRRGCLSSVLFCRGCHWLVHRCVLLAYFSPLDQSKS